MHLKSLSISHVETIGDTGLKHFLIPPQLKHLQLQKVGLKSEDMELLAESIKSSDCQLESLDNKARKFSRKVLKNVGI